MYSFMDTAAVTKSYRLTFSTFSMCAMNHNYANSRKTTSAGLNFSCTLQCRGCGIRISVVFASCNAGNRLPLLNAAFQLLYSQ